MLRYYFFAREFGWTPSQVDAEAWVRMDALMTVGGVAAELRREAQDRTNFVPAAPSSRRDGWMA
jgi:hypothetical protein